MTYSRTVAARQQNASRVLAIV